MIILDNLGKLTERNRIFLEERCSEGTMDDLVSLMRAVWNNYHVGQLITIIEQSTNENYSENSYRGQLT